MDDQGPRYGRWLAAILAAHVVLWTALPTLLYRSPPMDVAEALYWGHERPLGTYKHPSLPAWVADAVYEASGHQLWALYLLAQLTFAATVVVTWRLARTLLPERDALLAAAALFTLYLVSYISPEFNNNAALEPFWMLAMLCLCRATAPGTRRPLWWWLAAGLALGAAAWCKYSAAFLAGAAGLFLVFTKQGRTSLRTPGPYLCAAAALAVISPHLVWLRDNNFVSFTYAQSRPVRAGDRLLNPLTFLGAIVLTLVPAAAAILPVLSRPPLHRDKSVASRFITWMALGPIALHILTAAVLGISLRAAWASVLLVPLPLAVLTNLRTRERCTRLAFSACIAINLVLAATLVVYSTQTPHWPSILPRTQLPARELAHQVQQRWQSHFPGTRPSNIIGEPWLASETALFMEQRPTISAAYNYSYTPTIDTWLPPSRLINEGGAILWPLDPESPARLSTHLAQLFPSAIVAEPIDLTYPGSKPESRLRIAIALIPPADEAPALIPAPPPPDRTSR